MGHSWYAIIYSTETRFSYVNQIHYAAFVCEKQQSLSPSKTSLLRLPGMDKDINENHLIFVDFAF